MPRRHSKKSKKKVGGNSLTVPQDSPRRSSLRRPGNSRRPIRRVRFGSADSRPSNERTPPRPRKRSRSSSSNSSSSPPTKSTKTKIKRNR